MPVFVKTLTDGAHTAVHHIRRRNHIGSCFHMRKSGFGKKLKSGIILYLMAAEHAAVSVGGIFAHTYVRNIIHIRKLFFRFPKSLLNNSVFCIGSASHLVLVIRNTKQHNAADACFGKPFQFIGKAVHTVAELAFHGRNFLFYVVSLPDKQRINKR